MTGCKEWQTRNAECQTVESEFEGLMSRAARAASSEDAGVEMPVRLTARSDMRTGTPGDLNRYIGRGP
jgi:hypothetical protein